MTSLGQQGKPTIAGMPEIVVTSSRRDVNNSMDVSNSGGRQHSRDHSNSSGSRNAKDSINIGNSRVNRNSRGNRNIKGSNIKRDSKDIGNSMVDSSTKDICKFRGLQQQQGCQKGWSLVAEGISTTVWI
jgi:hypothetical protein